MIDQPYAGRLVGGAHHYAVRVYYEDTDAGGVVYHASYLRFMERARSDMLALCGIDQARALDTGDGGYVVAAADLRYLRAARLGEALVVVSRVEEVRAASCVVQQRVIRDGQVIVTGRLTIAFVSHDDRPRRQPASWIQALRVATEG